MPASLFEQGNNHFKSGELVKAEQCFKAALRIAPEHIGALSALVQTLTAQKDNRWTEALALMKRMLVLAPQNADFHINVGLAYTVLGNFEQAAAYHQKAIAIDPRSAKAYFHLAETKRFKENDPVFQEIARALSLPKMSDRSLSFLHFAAGKIHDDIGSYDTAFEHFRHANRLQHVTFDVKTCIALVDRIINTFSSETMKRKRGHGFEAHKPIFVVGMLRSGTTLVEQILSSHPRVAGAGELPDIESIARAIPQHHPDRTAYPEYLPTLDPHLFHGFGEAYLRRVGAIYPTADRIVDKMPQNFGYLGLIRLLFPNATIIHCKRHAYDTCLSCYFKRFRRGQEFSFALESLGVYYQLYERLMAHWEECDIGFHTIEYEQLIAKPESTVRQLLDGANLEWNESCLGFHKTKRTVETASTHQVRQPLYNTSVARWKHYEKHLEPLIAALPLAE